MLAAAAPSGPLRCLPDDFVNPFLPELGTAVISAVLLVTAAVLLFTISRTRRSGFRLLIVRLVSFAATWAVALAAATWLLMSTFAAWCAPAPAWRLEPQLQFANVIPVLVRITEFVAAVLSVVAVATLLRWLMKQPSADTQVRAE